MKKSCIVIILIVFGCVLAANKAMPLVLPQDNRITYTPVTKAYAGKSITLRLKVNENLARIIYVRLYFKQPREENYRFLTMIKSGEFYIGKIAPSYVKEPMLQLFFVALYDNNEIITFPEYDPYKNPEEIFVEQAGLETPAESPQASVPQDVDTHLPAKVLVLSPEPGELLPPDAVVIAVSFFKLDVPVDSSTIALFLDDKVVTSKAEISAFLINYRPERLAAGDHQVKVTARDGAGNPVGPVIWNFVVKEPEQKEGTGSGRARFSGRVYSNVLYENVSGQKENTRMLGGDFSGHYGNVSCNGRFSLTSREVINAQPRNRFQIAVKTPWLEAALGDNNPRLNNLMLWGKRIRGIESHLHLGFLNFDFVWGQSYRALEGAAIFDTLAAINGSDSLITRITRPGTFKQNVLALRPSIGRGDNFQFGICLVKAKDDTNSIKYGTMPADNIVIGPDLLLAFDRHRFEFRLFYAFSLLTNNIYGGALAKQKIEDAVGSTLPFDPAAYDRYLIINDSMIPLDPTRLTSTAVDAAIKLSYFKNTFRFGYKNIGPEYYSLAHPYLRKDIKGFYCSDRLRLYQNRLFIQLGYENYDDNFTRADGNPPIKLTTLEYAAGFMPGATYPRITISLRNHYRDNQVVKLDTSRVYDETSDDYIDVLVDRRENDLNREVAILLGYDVTVFNSQHALSLSYLSSNRIDRRIILLASTLPYATDLSTDMQMISVRSTYNQIPLLTSVSFASNKNTAFGGNSNFTYNFWSVGAEYSLFNRKLTLYSDFYTSLATGKNDIFYKTTSGDTTETAMIDYIQNTFRLGGIFRFNPLHYVMLTFNFIGFKDSGTNNSGEINPSFMDSIIQFRYEKRF